MTGQVALERMYLKDGSWESPKSPAVFSENWKPEIQVDINTKSSRIEETRYEVVLTVTIRTQLEGGETAFIVEIQQAGVFVLGGLEDEVVQRVLGTVCTTTLFPYAREAVDNLVVKGGFPALHLAPVNFEALYAEALRKQTEQQQQQPEGGSAGPVTH